MSKQINMLCPRCNYIPRNKRSLAVHMRRHQPDKFKRVPNRNGFSCRDCDERFRTMKILLDHKRSVHSNEPRVCHRSFSCEECGTTFSHRSTLSEHQIVKHGSKKQEDFLSCQKCEASFPTRSLLTKHVHRVHEESEAPYTCTLCSSAFRAQVSLDRHKLAKHSQAVEKGEMLLSCPANRCEFCEKQFMRSADLTKHILAHLKGTRRVTKNEDLLKRMKNENCNGSAHEQDGKHHGELRPILPEYATDVACSKIESKSTSIGPSPSGPSRDSPQSAFLQYFIS